MYRSYERVLHGTFSFPKEYLYLQKIIILPLSQHYFEREESKWEL